MGNVAERKRLRQEYLRKKGVAYSSAGLAGIFLIPVVIGTFLMSLVAFMLAVFITYQNNVLRILGFAIASGLTILGVVITSRCWQGYERGMEAASLLPYVPPVTKTTLPAEEILVRASDEPPVAQQDVLLRATTAGQEETGEELLRVTSQEER